MRTDRFVSTGVPVQIVANARQALIQLATQGPVYLHVGDSVAEPGDPRWVLWEDGTMSLGFEELESGDVISFWGPNTVEAITVIHNGDAPA